jgi:hypothetical protein
MNDEDTRRRLYDEPDFVASKRYDYSLKEMEERYPEVVPDNVIATVLMLSEEEVNALYETVVRRFRDLMGVKLDD